jgi:uncharacterized protein YyaL (SSP411 family)
LAEFRLSPNPNQSHLINWQPWGEPAFAQAQAENKPVILAVSAVWCYWCHVMDDSSYSDPDVVRMINEQFIPIRVDSDHRPDINNRYNVGGWPTTAFLTGHGGLIGGATYLPADQFLAMLMEVHRAYAEDKNQIYEHSLELLRQRKEEAGKAKAGPEIPATLVDQAARALAGAYDPTHGGFGEEPKFPNAPVLAFLLHLARTSQEDFYRAMLTKTLDTMAASSIFDDQEGGFFRHCANSDWSEAQWEKLLEDNLNVARVYLDAGLVLDNDDYKNVASRCFDFMVETLLDPEVPAFRGSQGSHSEYFGLRLLGRQEQIPPPVDPSCYAASNALAVSVLLDASVKLGRHALGETALSVLKSLDQAAEADNFSHVYDKDGPSQVPAFLGDWAYLLLALLAAHNHTAETSYLERAKAVAFQMIDRFFDEENGGFFDIELAKEGEPEPIGCMQVREKHLADNLAAVLGLSKLGHASVNDDYRSVAEATLSAFAETYREHGEFAASYGLAVDLWLNPPVEITIEGPPGDSSTQAMVQAATKVPYPNLEIKPSLADSLPAPAMAHICLNTVCLPPVTDPDKLASSVAEMGSPQGSPFEDIFQRFTGL